MTRWTEADYAAHLARRGVGDICEAMGKRHGEKARQKRRQAPPSRPEKGAPTSWPLILTLPFPPSVNTYWRKGKGRMYLSPRGRQYKKDVSALVLLNYFARGGEARISIPLSAELDFYPPDRRKRDLDNFEKGLWDSLVFAGVLLDDSIVRNVQKRWHEPVKLGKVEVKLWPEGIGPGGIPDVAD